jgi:hypothetical protein
MEIITTGHTRIVILAGTYAFKIARTRIGYCIQRTINIVKSRETRQKVAKWRCERGGVIRVVWQALTGGIGANIREYRLSRQYPDSGLAETLFTCGIVNVQRRGERVAVTDISAHPIVQAVTAMSTNGYLDNDTLRPDQFCRIDGRVRLVDYGNPILSDFLALRSL